MTQLELGNLLKVVCPKLNGIIRNKKGEGVCTSPGIFITRL